MDASKLTGPGNPQIWAVNENGWFAPLSHDGRLVALQGIPGDVCVNHFPRAFDGRITAIQLQPEQLQLSGWVSRFDGQPVSEPLAVLADNRFFAFDLQQNLTHSRPVSAENQMWFRGEVECVDLTSRSDVFLFAVGQDGRTLERLHMTPEANRRFAQQTIDPERRLR
ncbi:MAG: hypothetical protein R3C03_07785 [Pirellulaceae bacterium]